MSEPALRQAIVVNYQTFRAARERAESGEPRPLPRSAARVLSEQEIEHRRAMLQNLGRPRLIRVTS
jgi:hypothetical protein